MSKESTPRLNLTERRSTRIRQEGPPLSPSYYFQRSLSADAINRTNLSSSSINLPRSTVALVDETCRFLQRSSTTSSSLSSIGHGSTSYFSDSAGGSKPKLSFLKMPPPTTNDTLTTTTVTSGSSSQVGNLVASSPFTNYIEVPKSLINESLKFFGTQNDHANYKDLDDKDPYVTATQWLTYLEQRVDNNEIARLSLAKATAKGPARIVILGFAGESNSWATFKTKVIERYTRSNFQDCAVKIAELFSGGRKTNQTYEIFLNEVLNTFKELHAFNPDLFSPVGLTKCLFLASIPATLRSKIDLERYTIPEGIKSLELQLDQRRDRLQIEHRASHDELLFVKRNSDVNRSAQLEVAAVVPVQAEKSNQVSGKIFQGTRLINRDGQSKFSNTGRYQEPIVPVRDKIICYKCGLENHYAKNCFADLSYTRGRNRGYREVRRGNFRGSSAYRGHRNSDRRGSRGRPQINCTLNHEELCDCFYAEEVQSLQQETSSQGSLSSHGQGEVRDPNEIANQHFSEN